MFESRCKELADGGRLLYAWFPSMHTRVDIAIRSHLPSEEIKAVVGGIQQLLSHLESTASRFDSSSELSALNRQAGGDELRISPILEDMLTLCLEYNVLTDGYFDIAASRGQASPGTSSLLRIDHERHTARILHPETGLDLSGFLKGYALDLTRLYLEDSGIDNMLMSFGTSSIMALGTGPGENGWPVRDTCAREVIILRDSFLTTSGNDTGERTHILIPQSGELVEGEGMISIETTSGWAGEMIATALFAARAAGEDERLMARLQKEETLSGLLGKVSILDSPTRP